MACAAGTHANLSALHPPLGAVGTLSEEVGKTRRLLEEARADNVSLYEKVGGGGVGWGGRVEADNVPLYEKEVS